MSGFLIGFLLFMCIALFVGYRTKNQECEKLKQTIADLEAKLDERPLPAQPEEPETGSFIRSQVMRRATPETYRNVFDLDINGQRVIDHLQLTFANKSTYVRGGQDAERESCFKAGQATVVGFIINQINKANDPNYKDEVND